MLKLCHWQRRKADGLKVIVAKGYYYLILLDLKVTVPTGWCYYVHGSKSPVAIRYSDTNILARSEFSLSYGGSNAWHMLAKQETFTVYGGDTKCSSLAMMAALKNIGRLSYVQINPAVSLPSKPAEGLRPGSTGTGKGWAWREAYYDTRARPSQPRQQRRVTRYQIWRRDYTTF